MDKSNREILVSVRAMPRKGYDGFARGGRKWSSGEATFAFVTLPLLAILRAEPMIAVDSGVDLPDDVDPATIPHLDVPKRTFVDEGALALEEAKALDAAIAAEKAKAEVARKRAELAKLRASNAARESAEAKPPDPKVS